MAGQGSLSPVHQALEHLFQEQSSHESLSVTLTVKEASFLGHCGMGTVWSECCVPLEFVC